MAVKAENITNYSTGKNAENLADWDSQLKPPPPSSVGEFAQLGCDPVVADLNKLTFTETSRTPYDGDESRSQAKFPTNDAPDQKQGWREAR